MARRPIVANAGDLPIQSFADWDRVGQIAEVLRMLDWGQLRQAALLGDAMLRDDRIKAVIDTRCAALTAAPHVWTPADDSAEAASICEEMSGPPEGGKGLWRQICSPATRAELQKWGILLGIGVAELVWKMEEDAWVPRLKLWHPQFVYWDFSIYRYRLITLEGVITLPDIDENPRGDGKWFLYCPYGYRYGFLNGLLRSLAMLYLARQWTFRDWCRYNEVHGTPLTLAYVPEGAEEEDKARFVEDLANRGSDATVEVPVTPEGKEAGYSAELVEAKARTWEAFKDHEDKVESSMAICVLGQNLTTEISKGDGSRAAAQVHNQVRQDKMDADALMAEDFDRQVVTWWAEFNYGDQSLAPSFRIDVSPPANKLEEATALKTIGEAIAALVAACGNIVDDEAILDDAGVPKRSRAEADKLDAEDEAAAAEALAQIQSQGGVEDEGEDGEDQKDDKKPEKKALRRSRITREFQGIPIVIENAAGSKREWVDEAGRRGSTVMLYDYGFIDGHLSGDEEELDCYLGSDEHAAEVYVVHQLRAPEFKAWDEDKVMLGFASADAARTGYLAHRDDAPRSFGGMTTIPIERFKAKLRRRSPDSTGKIRARAALALRARPRGVELYSDRVAAAGRKLAARHTAKDAELIMEELRAATSLEDAKRRLIIAYGRRMKPHALAKLVGDALIMAKAGGMYTVVQEIPKLRRR